MSDLEPLMRDLVIANRILAHENIVDAYGHVSVRHPINPERYFLSCSRSPERIPTWPTWACASARRPGRRERAACLRSVAGSFRCAWRRTSE